MWHCWQVYCVLAAGRLVGLPFAEGVLRGLRLGDHGAVLRVGKIELVAARAEGGVAQRRRHAGFVVGLRGLLRRENLAFAQVAGGAAHAVVLYLSFHGRVAEEAAVARLGVVTFAEDRMGPGLGVPRGRPLPRRLDVAAPAVFRRQGFALGGPGLDEPETVRKQVLIAGPGGAGEREEKPKDERPGLHDQDCRTIEEGRRNVVTEGRETMSLVHIVLVLVVTGVVLWAINTYIPMQGTIKKILNIVVVICVVVWLLQVFGLLH
jgi:hypothetical protein